MVFTPIKIGDQEYRLRYPGLVQIEIEKNAAKELFGRKDQRFTLNDLLNFLNHTEVQAYLLWKGIQGGMPELRKMKFEEAIELRDRFLEAGELDSGEKLTEFTEIIATAVAVAGGADAKKLQAKVKQESEAKRTEELKQIYKAKILAEEEIKKEKEASIGERPPDSASEPST